VYIINYIFNLVKRTSINRESIDVYGFLRFESRDIATTYRYLSQYFLIIKTPSNVVRVLYETGTPLEEQ